MIPAPAPDTVIWALLGAAAGLFVGWAVTWAVLRRRHERAGEAARREIHRLSALHTEAAVRLEALAPLEARLREREARIDQLALRSARLETLIRQERREMQDRSAWLQDARRQLEDTYRSLSAAALKENNAAFLELARSVLKGLADRSRGDLDARREAVDRLIAPLRERLDRYDQQVQAMEKARAEAFGGIAEQMHHLVRTQESLRREAGRLATALRTPQVRGRWGELTLRKVAELSGMQAHCDFVEQPWDAGEEHRSRPDMLVRLPGGRQVVVDAKVPLNAYLEAVESDADATREEHLRRHADHVLSHIHQLSRKAYWSQFQPTPEFVVLFIPGENFFAAALDRNPGLIEEGVRRNVILATPTTLISLLKAVAFGWRQEKTTENARRIGELGQDLLDRLQTLTRHFHALGRDIGRAVTAYNRAVGSYERRVLAAARRFEDLGLAPRKGGSLDAVDTIDTIPIPPKGTNDHDATDP